MSTGLLQKNMTSPIEQEAYSLLRQLNEHNIIVAVNFMKKLIAEENNIETKQDELARKRAAFAKFMELREKIAATNPKSLEEERFEAMAEKYPFLRDDVKE